MGTLMLSVTCFSTLLLQTIHASQYFGSKQCDTCELEITPDFYRNRRDTTCGQCLGRREMLHNFLTDPEQYHSLYAQYFLENPPTDEEMRACELQVERKQSRQRNARARLALKGMKKRRTQPKAKGRKKKPRQQCEDEFHMLALAELEDGGCEYAYAEGTEDLTRCPTCGSPNREERRWVK